SLCALCDETESPLSTPPTDQVIDEPLPPDPGPPVIPDTPTNINIEVVDVVEPPIPPTGNPLDLPLLQKSDIAYLGSFQNAGNQRAYASGISPDGNMYMSAHENNGGYRAISEQTIPAVGGQASQVRGLTNTQGNFGGSGSFNTVSGFHYSAALDRIIYGHYIGYTPSTQTAELASMSADFTAPTTPQRVSDQGRSVNQRYYSGFMGAIPQEWQALLGGDMFIGGGPKSIDSNATGGFSLMAVNAADVDGAGVIAGYT
ncbi:unnamed protein product, partial [marine sediment metagenome]